MLNGAVLTYYRDDSLKVQSGRIDLNTGADISTSAHFGLNNIMTMLRHVLSWEWSISKVYGLTKYILKTRGL